MKFMKFPKGDLQSLVFSDAIDYLEAVKDTHEGSSRWFEHRAIVFKDIRTGKLYCAGYDVGLTESQEYRPFEDEGDEVECQEVEAVEVTTVTYKTVS